MGNIYNQDELMVIRTNIKNYCKSRGIKVTTIAAAIGKYDSWLNDVWHNKANMYDNDLNAIANHLNTTTDYLMGLTDNPNSDKQSYDDIMRDNAGLRRLVDRLAETGPETWNKVSKFLDMIET